MGEERDMFAGLGWEKEIRSLGDPHVPFNPSPEHGRGLYASGERRAESGNVLKIG